MKRIAIIPARGGSKRIPRKNIKEFLGKPIIAYSIEAALHSGLFDLVMVSTDDNEIASIAKKNGATVPFLRSKENADDFATTSDVLIEVLDQMENNYEYACCLYPTAPFVTSTLLTTAFEKLLAKNFDTVFPVLPFGFPIQRALKINSNSKMDLFYPENKNVRSQDLTSSYHDAGQFYWFKVDAFLSKSNLYTDNTGVIVLDEMKAHDIDNEVDWKMAELKFEFNRQNSIE